jgi:tetratricopeptide (TPR) repeat protein
MAKRAGGCWCVLLLLAAAIAGCAGPRGDIRPMIAMDGERMDVDDPVANGRALLLTGQYGLAVDALTRVLHDEPRNVRALNLIAEAYDRLHRYDLADRYHAEALEADPESVAALNNWGFSYLVRGDKTRAIGLLQRAAAIEGDQPVVVANLRLATGGAADASREVAPAPAASDQSEIRISEHVMLVRRTGKLTRLAPGVQLLVTTTPAVPELPIPVPPAPEVKVSEAQIPDLRVASAQVSGGPPLPAIGIAPLSYIAQPEPAEADPRVRNLAALQRLLDPSPFGYFPEIDDFNLKRQADSRPVGLSGSITMPAGYRPAG